MAGDGACGEHASTAEDVLQSSTDIDDGFISAMGIAQIELMTIKWGSSAGGENDGCDGTTQFGVGCAGSDAT